MKWSYSTISPTLTKAPSKFSAGFNKVASALGRTPSSSPGVDLKLGAYGSTTPGSYTTSKAPAPVGSVLSAPAFAPEFLSSAVNDLNEGQQLQAAMHADWRNSLLSAIQKGDSSLVPALTAASLSPGAKFSYGFGGAGGMAGGQPRQPSYWEQKLAMKDLESAMQDRQMYVDEQRQLGGSISTFQTPYERDTQEARWKAGAEKADQQANLARRVLGLNTGPGGKTMQNWDSGNTWARKTSSPSGWW